ncbi:hypothetical protein ACFOWE_24695 [Planomonospora corallina]|uniref:Uncharacterized protein n=1 Tax=Planomonospora corallina TaxID=1806052 RepID=A0ABV8IEN3_9ACTN
MTAWGGGRSARAPRRLLGAVSVLALTALALTTILAAGAAAGVLALPAVAVLVLLALTASDAGYGGVSRGGSSPEIPLDPGLYRDRRER